MSADSFERSISFGVSGPVHGPTSVHLDHLRELVVTPIAKLLLGITDSPDSSSLHDQSAWIRQHGAPVEVFQNGVGDQESTELSFVVDGPKLAMDWTRSVVRTGPSRDLHYIRLELVFAENARTPDELEAVFESVYVQALRAVWRPEMTWRERQSVPTDKWPGTLKHYVIGGIEAATTSQDFALPDWMFTVREEYARNRVSANDEFWHHVVARVGGETGGVLVVRAPTGPFSDDAVAWEKWHHIVAPVTVGIDWTRLRARRPPEPYFGVP